MLLRTPDDDDDGADEDDEDNRKAAMTNRLFEATFATMSFA